MLKIKIMAFKPYFGAKLSDLLNFFCIHSSLPNYFKRPWMIPNNSQENSQNACQVVGSEFKDFHVSFFFLSCWFCCFVHLAVCQLHMVVSGYKYLVTTNLCAETVIVLQPVVVSSCIKCHLANTGLSLNS